MLLFADCFFPVSFLLFTVLVPHHTLIVLMWFSSYFFSPF
jgi:hypothetical protein